ncbi:MAG: DNA polymerase I, partial [Acidobacteriota bacterium]|nr:DNA polymerase I [Acidobacteriota bacterium]
DAMLISYLLQPNRSNHGLSEIAFALLGEEAPPEAGGRCATVQRLFGKLQPQLESSGLKQAYRQIDLPLVEVLAELEWNGIRVDSAVLGKMSEDFERTAKSLTQRIYEVAGTEFNLNSPKQLGEILFDRLNLPTPRRLRKSGQYSTSVEVLEHLAKDYEVPRLMLEYRRIAKLKSGYVDALPRLVDPRTRRVHPSFHQTVAATGRLSCSNPNLQNIPIRSELGAQIRSAFVAGRGCRLLSADYSQIELRILAHLSRDPVLLDAFQRNEDIHTRTASEVFGIDPLLQTGEMRRRAKAINFGIIYGQTAFGLARELQISHRDAQEFIQRYFERYRGVKEFIDQTIQATRQSRVTRTLFGRHRQIPDINSRNPGLRQFAERTAVNSPIQGTAADLIKLAMIRIHRELRERKLESRMLLQVHDELVFEVPASEMETLQALVKQEMESVHSLSVPLVVDVAVGQNWMET